jgi:hypothetical protein
LATDGHGADGYSGFSALMSEGAGPRSEERHCADANGDHRFSDDEEPQSRKN